MTVERWAVASAGLRARALCGYPVTKVVTNIGQVLFLLGMFQDTQSEQTNYLAKKRLLRNTQSQSIGRLSYAQQRTLQARDAGKEHRQFPVFRPRKRLGQFDRPE